MVSRVALVKCDGNVQESFNQALNLIGGIGDLNRAERSVVLKVGVFNHKASRMNSPTVNVVSAIVDGFNAASQIYIAESDNYKGTALERLQIYKELFTERVVPFNLSTDTTTREVKIAGEKMRFSGVLFEPNVIVSTHALRRYEKGTILKNLFGLVPETKKARFHKKLKEVLLDTYEAIGGVDLAVIDATRTYSGPNARRASDTNLLLAGRDAVAVETVGAVLVGLKPEKMDVIQQAMERGLGEGDLENIEVLGSPVESLKTRFSKL
ncbi:MAG: DUF362 domain-containing protein [Candidatus Bathyarchaeota archaeon]|nr:MAG: DUF362 domain-containing protein [Candidatus Bathyarchaeota archaeon]